MDAEDALCAVREHAQQFANLHSYVRELEKMTVHRENALYVCRSFIPGAGNGLFLKKSYCVPAYQALAVLSHGRVYADEHTARHAASHNCCMMLTAPCERKGVQVPGKYQSWHSFAGDQTRAWERRTQTTSKARAESSTALAGGMANSVLNGDPACIMMGPSFHSGSGCPGQPEWQNNCTVLLVRFKSLDCATIIVSTAKLFSSESAIEILVDYGSTFTGKFLKA